MVVVEVKSKAPCKLVLYQNSVFFNTKCSSTPGNLLSVIIMLKDAINSTLKVFGLFNVKYF